MTYSEQERDAGNRPGLNKADRFKMYESVRLAHLSAEDHLDYLNRYKTSEVEDIQRPSLWSLMVVQIVGLLGFFLTYFSWTEYGDVFYTVIYALVTVAMLGLQIRILRQSRSEVKRAAEGLARSRLVPERVKENVEHLLGSLAHLDDSVAALEMTNLADRHVVLKYQFRRWLIEFEVREDMGRRPADA